MGDAASTERERLLILDELRLALAAALVPPRSVPESELCSLALTALSVLGKPTALRHAGLSELCAAIHLVCRQKSAKTHGCSG